LKAATQNAQVQTKFLLQNGMVEGYKELLYYYDYIKACQTNALDQMNNLKYIFLIIQLSLVIGYLVLKIFIVVDITKKNNLAWTILSENTYGSFYQIRDKCVSRLINQLDTGEEEAFIFNEYNRVQINKFHVVFSQVWSYLWRKLLYLSVTIVYFVVICEYLYPDIEKTIENHSLVVQVLYKRSYTLNTLNFWTISSINPTIDSDLVPVYFSNIVGQYLQTRDAIKDPRFKGILIGNLYQYLYNEYTGTNTAEGLYKETELVLLDSYYLFSTRDSQILNSYSNRTSALQDLTKVIISLADQQSRSLIEDQSTYLVLGIVFYCFFCVGVYFLFYLPFLNNRIRHIEKLQEIADMFMFKS
jgi:hypothetical protein